MQHRAGARLQKDYGKDFEDVAEGRLHRQAAVWSANALCRWRRAASMERYTLADSPEMSAQACLSAPTTSCMPRVVSDSPAPTLTCACANKALPHIYCRILPLRNKYPASFRALRADVSRRLGLEQAACLSQAFRYQRPQLYRTREACSGHGTSYCQCCTALEGVLRGRGGP